MTRASLWVLALGTALRLVVAYWLPLGTDEAYAIAVARQFSISFFDHPPLAFWLPVGMAHLTGIEHAFVYRLPFVICGTVTAVTLWRIGTLIGGARAGFCTLLLFTLAPYMLIGGGLFVVPDGPLDMFAALTALALIRALRAGPAAPLTAWLWVALWLALAMMCKYQATLIPVAVLVFLLLTPGQARLLLQPGPWIAAAIGIAGLAPVVIWNMQNDWASFAFHGARVGAQFQPANFAAMSVAQLLYLAPATALFAGLGIWQAFRSSAPETRLLALLAMVPIAMFMFTYIYGRNTFPHWTMPGWLFAMPLAGLWLSTASRRAFIWLAATTAPLWALLTLLVVHIPTGVLTNHRPLPAWDNTLQIFDYSGLDAALRDTGLLTDNTTIAATDWIWAGHLSTGLGGRNPTRVTGPAPHHFAYMDTPPGPALLLIPTRHGTAPDHSGTAAATVTLMRANRPYIDVTAYHIP